MAGQSRARAHGRTVRVPRSAAGGASGRPVALARWAVRVEVCAACGTLPSLCRCGWPENHARIEGMRASLLGAGEAPQGALAPLTRFVVWR